jgi:hypothetical protein
MSLSYCPESAKDDARFRIMCNVTLRCGMCGQLYRENENVGVWDCQGFYVWCDTLNARVKIPADHGGPWCPAETWKKGVRSQPDVASIPAYAMYLMKNVRPEAILESEQETNARGAVAVYESTTISRVDRDLYEKTQSKFWFQPPTQSYAVDGRGYQW